jgi:chorismate mutase
MISTRRCCRRVGLIAGVVHGDALVNEVYAISGETRVDADTPDAISAAVHELLDEIVGHDRASSVITAIFVSGAELHAAFPAAAAREWGLSHASLVGIRAARGEPRGLAVMLHCYS